MRGLACSIHSFIQGKNLRKSARNLEFLGRDPIEEGLGFDLVLEDDPAAVLPVEEELALLNSIY